MGGEGEKRERRKIRAQARFASGEKRKTFPFFFSFFFLFFLFVAPLEASIKAGKRTKGGRQILGGSESRELRPRLRRLRGLTPWPCESVARPKGLE